MKFLMLIFYLFFSLCYVNHLEGATFNPSITNRPYLTVGNRIFTDLTNLKIVSSFAIGAAGADNNSPRLYNGTSGYTPSGSKAFRILAAKFRNYDVSATYTAFYLGYCDNDLGINSAVTATNIVYLNGDQDSSTIMSGNIPITTDIELNLNFLIPNTKYICIRGGGVTGNRTRILLYGYEE